MRRTPSASRPAALLLALCAAAGLAACEGGNEEEGGTMKPGANCLDCHSGGEHRFTLAGTVYADTGGSAGLSGATVAVSDAGGNPLFTLTTNAVGNFYTSQAIPASIQVTVSHGGLSSSMPGGVSEGGCNRCHVPGRRITP